MKTLRYEKVGDVSSKYSFLEVYFGNGTVPFMEIAITGNKQLSFRTYVAKTTINLTLRLWEEILTKAKEFLPEVLKDEETLEAFEKGVDNLKNG